MHDDDDDDDGELILVGDMNNINNSMMILGQAVSRLWHMQLRIISLYKTYKEVDRQWFACVLLKLYIIYFQSLRTKHNIIPPSEGDRSKRTHTLLYLSVRS